MSQDAKLSPTKQPDRTDTTSTTIPTLPIAGVVRTVTDGVLGVVGVVAPQTRRLAVYAGAALLGAVGVVEWPVAATVAAAVWLTQARPDKPAAVDEQSATRTGGQRRRDTAKVTEAATTPKPSEGRSTAKVRPTKANPTE
ncbi:hypothetical protein [Allokutzneria oryzae]|uniref:Phage holin family protein n=1 Tax=Allokutzneria oryzae TaxID=1378989 RepID=A0ABV6A3Q0_9PSEU